MLIEWDSSKIALGLRNYNYVLPAEIIFCIEEILKEYIRILLLINDEQKLIVVVISR